MRVMIVDDHWAIREGLRFALGRHDEIEVIGEATGSQDLKQQLSDGADPDVLVLDIQMQDESGLEVLSWIKAQHPRTKVVMHSMYDDPAFVRRAIELGADGYVLKSAGADELARAFEIVKRGGLHIQGEATRALVAETEDAVPSLSPREREIIGLIAQGFENKQIARQLGISETTVKTHLRNAFGRLQVTSRSEAVAIALRLGLIE